MVQKALEGVKILEYCRSIGGAYTTKLMADLGAEVIKIEPPEIGDEARQLPPFPGDVPHPEKSGLFLYLNINKLGITLDPRQAAGAEIFKKLAKEADILIEDGMPDEMEKMGLGYETLKALNPGLIMASLTPFGRSGPYKNYKAYQLNIAHLGGQANLLPTPSPNLDRAPVKPGGHACEYDTAMVSSVAIMAALFWKEITGNGQFIELSKLEASMSLQRIESAQYPNHGFNMTRLGGVLPQAGGIMPCLDGYVVFVTPEEHQWTALMALMGNPEWSKEEWCKDPFTRSQHANELNLLIMEWTKQRTKEEIFRKGQVLSTPVAPLQSAEDMIHSEQLNKRGFFIDAEHPVIGKIKFPTSPYRFSETPWQLTRFAPCLGEHNEEIYCKRLGYTKRDLVEWGKSGII